MSAICRDDAPDEWPDRRSVLAGAAAPLRPLHHAGHAHPEQPRRLPHDRPDATQPELGLPWFMVAHWPVYRPWSIFPWWYHFDAYAPRVFDRAVVPPFDISRTKPLVRLILNQIGRRLTEQLHAGGGKPARKLLLMLTSSRRSVASTSSRPA